MLQSEFLLVGVQGLGPGTLGLQFGAPKLTWKPEKVRNDRSL